MKKIVLLLLLFGSSLFLPSTAFAQIGLKAGIGIGDIVFADQGQTPYLGYEVDYLTHRVPMLSYQFGAYGSFALNSRWVLQTELLYAKQGLNYDIDFLYDEVTYRLGIHYLQLPVLIHYRTQPKQQHFYSYYAGPYFAQRLKATRTRVIDGQETKDNMSNVKAMDFGMMLGFASHLNTSRGAASIDLRMTYSMINMMDPIEDGLWNYERSTEERARNVNVSLAISYPIYQLKSQTDEK